MKNAIFAITAVCALLCAPAFSSGEGTSSAKFLKADSGARSSALGGAYTAVSDDADAVNYNPAGMVQLGRQDEAYFTHNEWISGFRQENLSYVRNTPAGAFGAGLVYFHSGAIAETDMAGSYTGGEFEQSDMAFSVNYAYRHDGRLSLGAGVKLIRESLYGHSAMSGALDAGALYAFSDDLRLGLTIRNIGPGIKLYEESFPLPFAVRAGAAYTYRANTLFSADLEKARDSGLVLKFGAEYRVSVRKSDVLALRLGYCGARDEDAGSGLTGGLGFKVERYVIDYSFSPFGELGNAHRFSFGMAFGPAVKKTGAHEEYAEESGAGAASVSGKSGEPPAAAGAIARPAEPAAKPAVQPLPAQEIHAAPAAEPVPAVRNDTPDEGISIEESVPQAEPVAETKEECVSRCVASGTLDSIGCISRCGPVR
ncbi:MAG: PorV/PorQ family protein [Elusimicrobiaceae bacterium]|nr:PorV/PorQ family protein [Elusimicrobiaceae bacterium]